MKKLIYCLILSIFCNQILVIKAEKSFDEILAVLGTSAGIIIGIGTIYYLNKYKISFETKKEMQDWLNDRMNEAGIKQVDLKNLSNKDLNELNDAINNLKNNTYNNENRKVEYATDLLEKSNDIFGKVLDSDQLNDALSSVLDTMSNNDISQDMFNINFTKDNINSVVSNLNDKGINISQESSESTQERIGDALKIVASKESKRIDNLMQSSKDSAKLKEDFGNLNKGQEFKYDGKYYEKTGDYEYREVEMPKSEYILVL